MSARETKTECMDVDMATARADRAREDGGAATGAEEKPGSAEGGEEATTGP